MIGGGASGIFCAVNAARLHPDWAVTVIEKSRHLLSKVKVSGGGRCNVTHACFDVNELVKRYPRGGPFLKKTFYQFGPADTVQWFSERGVQLKTEADGRMFPVTDQSQTIIDCLMREANQYKVNFIMGAGVEQVRRTDEGWELEIREGQLLQGDAVVVACGGFPKASQFAWLEALGHSIEPPVPSLFTFNLPGNPIVALMGVAVPECRVKITGTKLETEGPVLITHWGLSGPAILRLSAWGARLLAEKDWQFTAMVNWVPQYNENTVREFLQEYRSGQPSNKIQVKNPLGLPARLWEFFLLQCGVGEGQRWGELTAKALNQLAKLLCTYTAEVKGKTTFKEEFVTAGGIRLSEIDPQTMESKKHKGLFFAGEIVDVDGITGGFNFQHAWTSGWIVASRQ